MNFLKALALSTTLSFGAQAETIRGTINYSGDDIFDSKVGCRIECPAGVIKINTVTYRARGLNFKVEDNTDALGDGIIACLGDSRTVGKVVPSLINLFWRAESCKVSYSKLFFADVD